MRWKLLLFFLSLTPLASACAVYDGVAYFHGSGEVIDLKIDKHLKTGMSYIEASGERGLICSGSARTVHSSKSYWSCKGEDGKLTLACNDGRHLVGVWSAESCSSGQGAGGDQYGNTFVLAYGERREDALRKVGAGPGGPHPAFDGAAAVNPLYTAFLGYEGEGGPVLYSPREPAEQTMRPLRGGSGFFSSPDGHIVTSAGSLKGAASVGVYLPDKRREFPARIVSVNNDNDIAVLKISAGGKVGSAVRVNVRKTPQAGEATER